MVKVLYFSIIVFFYHIHATYEVLNQWDAIGLPLKSNFRGFLTPKNETKWIEAREIAKSGDMVLFKKVASIIKSEEDIYATDKNFVWLNCDFADVYMTNDMQFRDHVNNFPITTRAPIVHFGKKLFSGNCSLHRTKTYLFPTSRIVQFSEKVTRKFVGIGQMDENWGWLSTFIVNRTATWQGRFDRKNKLTEHLTNQETIQSFLDNPNLIMLLVNQHHNITHPKVLSLPLGVADKHFMLNSIKALNKSLQELTPSKKRILVYSAGSMWKFRAEIIQCVRKQLGEDDLVISKTKLTPAAFFSNIAQSYAVLCMPGLGYDTYRIWETLLMGSMPIIEQGVGLERTLWKLPAIIVEDFGYLTPEKVREAYIEAIYYIDEWDYSRLTSKYWRELLLQSSATQNTSYMVDLHPMQAVDENFVRPLIPFECSSNGNGCGLGTKTIPRNWRKQCAVDATISIEQYLSAFNNK